MAITSERTRVSPVAATSWAMLASRSPQKPDDMHSVGSFLTTMRVPRGKTRARSAVTPVSAVSVPSNPSTRWVPSQKGLSDDRPQRQSE